MNGILVSVVIPTHNRTIELYRAINSVCNQSYKNIEIIVVNDNFENKQLQKQIYLKLKDRDSRIIVINNKKQLGAALSRNAGIKKASGKYIAFLDDDDECDAERIKKQLALFYSSSQKNLGLVYCFGKLIYPNGKIEIEQTDYIGIPLEEHMKNNLAGTSFWLVKSEAIKSVDCFEKISSHQDGIVILKLLVKGYSVDVVRESLINYYHHDKTKGITGVTNENLQADYQYFKRCQTYFYLLTSKAQRRVFLHFYDDRNWNLIMLGKSKEAIKDIKYLLSKKIFNPCLIKCILRCTFKNYVILKEEKRLKSHGLL